MPNKADFVKIRERVLRRFLLCLYCGGRHSVQIHREIVRRQVVSRGDFLRDFGRHLRRALQRFQRFFAYAECLCNVFSPKFPFGAELC